MALAGIAAFFRIFCIFLHHIVVTVEHIKPFLFPETGKQPKNVAMCFHDLFHAAVFPKFVSVAELDIGESCFVIVLKGGKIQVLVS